MKTVTTMLIAAAAMLAGAATAKPVTSFRASTPSYRAPAPAYRAPAPVYHAPAPVVRAPAPVVRAPVAAPRAPAVAKAPVRAATPRVTATAAGGRQTVVARRTPTGRDLSPDRATAHGRTTYRYGGRDYGWNSPSLMPVWWMAAMHRSYTESAYDDFLRRCIQTPRERRSRECVRALRERGYTY